MKAKVIFALLVTALFPLCVMDPRSDGSGSTTETALLTGRLYLSDGKTPAAGVQVKIRPRKTLPSISSLAKRLADTASTITDGNGEFAFDTSLDTGTYVIEASDGNNAALIDSVTVGKSDSVVKVEDTLKPAGAIKGVIRLSE